jgi:ribonucleoside-diphosphate reductase alpha chain
VFVHVGQHGGAIGSLMDCLAIAISIGLQHGVPLAAYLGKLERQRFEPSGRTDDPALGHCASVVDAVARALKRRFCPDVPDDLENSAG